MPFKILWVCKEATHKGINSSITENGIVTSGSTRRRETLLKTWIDGLKKNIMDCKVMEIRFYLIGNENVELMG